MPSRPPVHRNPHTRAAPRPSSADRGYDARWRKARLTYLTRHPWCAICAARGIQTPAKVIDHIVPHRGNQALFWDTQNNWQPACVRCHNQKTGRGQ